MAEFERAEGRPQRPLFLAPRLHTNRGSGERHATWLELFFDLVFVVAVAEVAHLLHDDHSLMGIAVFVALFLPVWWLWIDFSYYADQFDTESLFGQVVTLLAMFGVLVLALTISKVTHDQSLFFGATYAVLRVVITLLYAWAWRVVPESRELARRYTLSFAIALVIWIVSLFVPPPLRFVLWGLALLIEISNGPITYATIKQVPQQVSHMDERFGLFLIIVLGEAVLAVAQGVADTEWVWPAPLTGFVGFAIAAGLWWLYFNRADASVINQALRGSARARLVSYVYGYTHFLIFVGIAATGVGSEFAIHAVAESHLLSFTESLLLGGGMGLCLLGIAIVHWAAPNSLARPVLLAHLLGVLACVALVFVGVAVSPLLLLLLLAAVLLSVAMFEARYVLRNAALPQPTEASRAAGD